MFSPGTDRQCAEICKLLSYQLDVINSHKTQSHKGIFSCLNCCFADTGMSSLNSDVFCQVVESLWSLVVPKMTSHNGGILWLVFPPETHWEHGSPNPQRPCTSAWPPGFNVLLQRSHFRQNLCQSLPKDETFSAAEEEKREKSGMYNNGWAAAIKYAQIKQLFIKLLVKETDSVFYLFQR